MSPSFNYDWFYGAAFHHQMEESRWRCAIGHFPDLQPEQADLDEAFTQFRGEIECRCLIYLRDGFSYEVKDFIEAQSKSHLTFECEPVDDQYRVGSFVVTVPFDEIVRVEVFAVHPQEKPREAPQITGFSAGQAEVVEQRTVKPQNDRAKR